MLSLIETSTSIDNAHYFQKDPIIHTKHRTRWTSQSLIWANELNEFILTEQEILLQQTQNDTINQHEIHEGMPLDENMKLLQDSLCFVRFLNSKDVILFINEDRFHPWKNQKHLWTRV